MRLLQFVSLAQVLVPTCFALLEERFVGFQPGNGSLDITNVQILYSFDDYVGVRIAAESLAKDYADITGAKPEVRNVSRAGLGHSGNSMASGTAIIVGSLKSSLIKSLAGNGTRGLLDVEEIQGKWETFKTAVVANPLPGVRSALVIAGSDKRGAIYGIHTLGEQCGQSPYVWSDVVYCFLSLKSLGTTGSPTCPLRNMMRSMPYQKRQSTANRV
jgi:hypothetical protein